MKYLIVSLFLMVSMGAFAVSPVREALDIIPSKQSNQVMFSTNSIPAQGSVVVRCDVKLPRFYNEHFSFYVSPQSGDFGQIKEQYFSGKSFIAIPVGSKIYTTNNQYGYAMNSTLFYITRVKQSNEAIVIDLSHMPDGTTADCTF